MRALYGQAETGLELYDLKSDVGELNNVIGAHPDVVDRLQRHAEIARAQLGDKLTGRTGDQVRPAGKLGPDDPKLAW
ncbi:MAG TPA: hypothetical protein VM165_17130 [Planctomycetaceae bacterium]|nr:hypothetical protein [Planctomycetaceae bacterium]